MRMLTLALSAAAGLALISGVPSYYPFLPTSSDRSQPLPDRALAQPQIAAPFPASVPLEDVSPSTTASVGVRQDNCRDVLGVSRVIEIDTAGGPGFGSNENRARDFLKSGEVVLTFDDGPWPRNTHAVLAALAAQCTKATFFAIGKHSVWHPKILQDVVTEGHTVGSHTWSHVDLAAATYDQAKSELETGISAIASSTDRPPAPFFRFPGLRKQSPVVEYLAERNIAFFSADVDSLDYKLRKPEQVVTSVMTKLTTRGRGIILMHDFQTATAAALPTLLARLKAGGYSVVHLKAKAPLDTLPKYDAELLKMRPFGRSAEAR